MSTAEESLSFLLIVNRHLCGPELGIFLYVCFCNWNKFLHTKHNLMELNSDVTAVTLPILLFGPICPSDTVHQVRSLPDTVHLAGMWREGYLPWSWTAVKLHFSEPCPALWKSCKGGCLEEHPSTFIIPYLVSGFKPKQHESVNSQEKLLSDLTVWHDRQWKDSLISPNSVSETCGPRWLNHPRISEAESGTKTCPFFLSI